MNKIPLQIGVTGGIGSGKSIICRVFATFGVPVYDADSRAKWLMNNSLHLKKAIIDAFGENSYTPDGQLNRAFLASQVFNDPNKTFVINALVHPAVALDYTEWLAQNQKQPYVIREAALMIESNSHKYLDKLITVFCPLETRIQRIKKRDPQRSIQEIEGIIAKQIPEEEKLRLADYVIQNDDKQPVLPQILAIHQEIISQKL